MTQVSLSFTVQLEPVFLTVSVHEVAPAGIESFLVTLPAIDQSSLLSPHFLMRLVARIVVVANRPLGECSAGETEDRERGDDERAVGHARTILEVP